MGNLGASCRFFFNWPVFGNIFFTLHILEEIRNRNTAVLGRSKWDLFWWQMGLQGLGLGHPAAIYFNSVSVQPNPSFNGLGTGDSPVSMVSHHQTTSFGFESPSIWKLPFKKPWKILNKMGILPDSKPRLTKLRAGPMRTCSWWIGTHFKRRVFERGEVIENCSIKWPPTKKDDMMHIHFSSEENWTWKTAAWLRSTVYEKTWLRSENSVLLRTKKQIANWICEQKRSLLQIEICTDRCEVMWSYMTRMIYTV